MGNQECDIIQARQPTDNEVPDITNLRRVKGHQQLDFRNSRTPKESNPYGVRNLRTQHGKPILQVGPAAVSSAAI